MHIVYLVENIDVAGGIERSLITRVNYMIESCNYEITIVCTNKNTGLPYYQLHSKAKLIFLDPLTAKKTLFGRIYLRFLQSKQIINLHSDIIISVKYTLHNLFFYLLRKNQKLISELREPKEQYNLESIGIKNKLNIVIRNLVFKQQNGLIVLTNTDKQNWGFNNMHVVPNPILIDTKEVSNLKNKQILAIGRLHPIKGFDLLIKAWKKVITKHDDWQLKICGEGSEYLNLMRICSEFNLLNNVAISNQFSDVVPEFLNTSIFVMTSKFEAFGNVLVEAKGCGVPSIAFDAPSGPREIIMNGLDGFIVPVYDIDALAEKIIFLIENETVRIEMGRKAKINSELYSLDKVMKLYIKVITKC